MVVNSTQRVIDSSTNHHHQITKPKKKFQERIFKFIHDIMVMDIINAFATGDFEKHIELQQINDAYMRRW